ncbi:ABC transporter ATP-binding protein [Tessaracoccus sp. MC1679]|uniref:ABC transporter ATP-binding protein n=1 Tax=unclassified Tessaracoccus TaxID=2635419 RepID=UPI001602A889|nr:MULTISPECIES: ABC transporter ATP-binding protein [unclassified Tessaracoccus]MBB1511039.1 ABC transporter ATP-binding protein [Tessaracoccus sp. MC1627]MBB1517286.1 ABC transporter ATP-binding protein [Tessaracoccus sp. MC1679]
MTNALEIRDLTKTFGRTVALNKLNLDVQQGEVHGFLGPNGAGKTTTLRILLGLLRPDSGTATVLGGHPVRDAVELHKRIAYVPGDVELWPQLTGGEAIDVLTRLRGDSDPARIAELCERFDLDRTKKGRTYSKGNRQKVALVAALASGADLFILDEPTSGLDPLMEAIFQDEVRGLIARGATVLLSSHILGQVEALAHRVSIIREGSIVETGTLDAMRHLRRTTIQATTAQPVNGLAHMTGVHHAQVDGDRVSMEVDGEHLGTVMSQLTVAGVQSIVAHPPTLEQMLLRHYGEETPR